MKKVENILELRPMEEYEAPSFPTHQERSPELLEKMPLRWRRKALLTGAGLLTAVMITGCVFGSDNENSNPLGSLQSGNESDYDWDLHHGGAGEGPIYVVYLTEQEVLGIIRSQLEAAGLKMSEISSGDLIYVGDRWYRQAVGMELFDERNNVGVVVIDNWPRVSTHDSTVEAKDAILEHYSEEGMHVGVIFSREREAWSRGEKDQLENEVREDLYEQIENFIEELRNENVID